MTADAASALPTYCSEFSLKAVEPLIGSATPTTRFLLLESNEAWGEKALDESAIPEPVKKHIQSFVKSDPMVKALLIHRPRSDPSKRLKFFMASADEQSQWLIEIKLQSYEALLEIDFDTVFANPEKAGIPFRQEPLLLVCTNGRRDLCCARLGVPVFNALAREEVESAGLEVWQCTHLGGHRFAANVIVLPYGLLYGRVNLDNALQLLKSTQKAEIFLPNLRGRMAYPPPAQAADRHLRLITGEFSLSAFSLLQMDSLAENQWQIEFKHQPSGEIFSLLVRTEKAETTVFDSCRFDKTATFTQHTITLITDPAA